MKKPLLLILLTLGYLIANAQIDLAPNNGFAVCPDTQITYSASMTNGSFCSFNWEITGGTFSGGSTTASGTVVTVTWSSSATSGTLKLTTVSCSLTGDNNLIVTKPFAIKSLSGVNLDNISGPTSVNVNVTTSIRYSVPLIQYPRGSSDPDPFYVTNYVWTVPSGWTITNTNYSVSNQIAYIDVTPDCCTGGLVTVKAKSSCGNFFSNIKQLTVTRFIPTPGPITSSTGKTTVLCTDTTPITYSIASVTGATSYTWTLPANWGGTSSTTSIVATPNGLNGGVVSVKANGGGLQSQASSLPISVIIVNPNNPLTISGAETVCTANTSYTLQNAPSFGTVKWSASPCNLFTSCSGNGTSATLKAANSSIQGEATLTFTVQTQCGTVNKAKGLWVGKPDVGASYISGADNTNCSIPYSYSYLGGAAGASSMTWEASNHFTLGANGLNATLTPVYYGEGYLSMKASNTCGSTYACLTVCATGCDFGLLLFPNHPCATFDNCGFSLMSAYPNPVEESLTIKLSDDVEFNSGEKYSIKILDESGNIAFNGIGTTKEFIVKKDELKSGRYIVQCTANGKMILNQRLIVK